MILNQNKLHIAAITYLDNLMREYEDRGIVEESIIRELGKANNETEYHILVIALYKFSIEEYGLRA